MLEEIRYVANRIDAVALETRDALRSSSCTGRYHAFDASIIAITPEFPTAWVSAEYRLFQRSIVSGPISISASGGRPCCGSLAVIGTALSYHFRIASLTVRTGSMSR